MCTNATNWGKYSKDEHKSNTIPGTKCFQSKERAKNKYQKVLDKKIPLHKHEDIDFDLAAQCSCKLHALVKVITARGNVTRSQCLQMCGGEKIKDLRFSASHYEFVLSSHNRVQRFCIMQMFIFITCCKDSLSSKTTQMIPTLQRYSLENTALTAWRTNTL